MQHRALIDDADMPPAAPRARDLCDGQEVETVFVVRDRAIRETGDGKRFVRLQLGDVSGRIEGVAHDLVDDIFELATVGSFVRVAGRVTRDGRRGARIALSTVAVAEPGEYDEAVLLESSPHSAEVMEAGLRELVDTVQDPHLRALLDSFFAVDCETWPRYRDAPAAKHYHQAYRHGLLEHSLSVAQGVSALSATFPGIDRDVAVTGALLHDIGKIEAYARTGGTIVMTDAGKLQGEISLGYFMVRMHIEALPGFPAETAQAVLHIILSHHGKYEHGSPVVPCTREATLVHMVDNLGGTLGSFDRIEKTLRDGETWSSYDRGISSSAYFAPREAAA